MSIEAKAGPPTIPTHEGVLGAASAALTVREASADFQDDHAKPLPLILGGKGPVHETLAIIRPISRRANNWASQPMKRKGG
eukprot:scaffold18285_cov35-Tisochrysis_lutea.AAC.11